MILISLTKMSLQIIISVEGHLYITEVLYHPYLVGLHCCQGGAVNQQAKQFTMECSISSEVSFLIATPQS